MDSQDERLSTLAETLRRKLEEASAVISGLEEEKARLQSQVGSREEEIARLGKQISADGNLNLDKVRWRRYGRRFLRACSMPWGFGSSRTRSATLEALLGVGMRKSRISAAAVVRMYLCPRGSR